MKLRTGFLIVISSAALLVAAAAVAWAVLSGLRKAPSEIPTVRVQ